MNVGERIGDYEIVEVLGAGGMGEVFKVRNTLSGRIEAMKVLHANLAGDKELAERFQREIRVQAALDHPHIARLNTAQLLTNQQGATQLVMVMEFVEGESLAQMLQRGPIGLSDCVRYAVQVLDALGYAHEHGVVHRDIKPANIMCTRQGVIKLMDFGIARMAQDRKLTDTGKTVGSLHYMSPEQIQGIEPEPRSDIYSFGITLYEMATGKKPFDGASNYSIMSAHLQQQPVPPINVTAGVPEALSQIILMAIAKDPGQRFQTAKAFASALQSVQPGPTMSMVTPSAPVAGRMAPPAPPPAPMMAPTVPVAAGPAPISNLPNYGAPQMPPPSVAGPPRSMRGLYMVLGSVVTILVLAVVAFEAPKYFRAVANTTKTDQVSKTPLTTQPVTTPPATRTSPQAVDAAAPASAQENAAPASQLPSTTAQTPVPESTRPSSMPQTTPQTTPQTRPQTAPQTTAQITPAPPPTTQQTAPPAAAIPQTPPAVVAPPVNRELNEAREQYNELSVRASASKASLDSIAQQMRSQGGLGLRRDIIEAQTRLDYQMKEAMDSIRSGDVNAAREHLQFASGNLQVIDKFLGH
jgi:serine/threonine-protein kinase